MTHYPVLLQETIDLLAIKQGDIFVDGTLGNGGHSEEVIKRFGKSVKIFGIDLDTDALERSKNRLSKFDADITFLQGNFRNMSQILEDIGIKAVDKILLDIGMSSNQLEESGRGFSFQKNEPLHMSFKKDISKEDFDASQIVNLWDEDSLRTIIKHYGEEKFAGRIAKGIVKTRELSSIERTEDLVNIVLASTPKFYHRGRIHPATRTFQALRIAVNDELRSLEDGLANGTTILSSGGRIGVISFHSLEDRIVKNYFKTMEQVGFGERITKKPIVSKDEEIEKNPRSRSAKFRVFEKK